MNYALKHRLYHRIACNTLLIAANDLVICTEKQLECLDFGAAIHRWRGQQGGHPGGAGDHERRRGLRRVSPSATCSRTRTPTPTRWPSTMSSTTSSPSRAATTATLTATSSSRCTRPASSCASRQPRCARSPPATESAPSACRSRSRCAATSRHRPGQRLQVRVEAARNGGVATLSFDVARKAFAQLRGYQDASVKGDLAAWRSDFDAVVGVCRADRVVELLVDLCRWEHAQGLLHRYGHTDKD